MSTLPANFSVPIWRDYALALGSGSCERKSIKQRLLYGKPGTSMMIAIGGAEEFKYMTEGLQCSFNPSGTLDLVLLKRKGFAKIALMTGASPVPVIGFGENELYHRVTHSFFQPLHGVFQTLFKAAAPLFYGQFGTLFPKQHPLVTVVGKPVEVDGIIENPTQEQIDELHARYVNSLRELYDEYKDNHRISQEAAYQDIIRKTLNEKCSELERNTQIVIREANQEIEALQEKYKVASHDRELEKRRIHELTEQMNEKSRQLQKLQVLYDKLKRKTPISQKESDIQVPNGHFLKHDRSTFKFEKLQHNVHSSTDRFTLPSKFGQSRSGDVNLTPRTFTSFMNQNSSRFESPARPSSRASFRR
ncbi:diacylglycerol O-acyltransferase 1 [Globomyces sp. JEL0801]|nr:diacylglycerol O-acyltransferase 1 [Globomyces sp. JEL0801]